MPRYFLLLIPFILLRLLTFPLALFVVPFQKDYHLPYGFKWMDTIDNSLLGDGGWQQEHCKGESNTYCCMVKWMWRNGGNWAAYYWFGYPAGQSPFWSVKDAPGLQWRLGWSPNDSKLGRTKINLAIRYRNR